MALNTYSGLSTGVFRRLNRTAETTPFDDALSLTEAEINRRLALSPVRPMHSRATATINAEYIGAPTDIIDANSFYIAVGSDVVELMATSPENMTRMYQEGPATGAPQFYTQEGAEFRFYPEPDQSYTGTLIYWAKITPITNADPTNWLLSAHPDVYFHGVLAHLYQEYFDTPNYEAQAALFDMAIQKVLDAYPKRVNHAPLRSDISENRLSGRSWQV